MRNNVDHVFIDCGPLGLAGRGGHGHNDCLAFEAVLQELNSFQIVELMFIQHHTLIEIYFALLLTTIPRA